MQQGHQIVEDGKYISIRKYERNNESVTIDYIEDWNGKDFPRHIKFLTDNELFIDNSNSNSKYFYGGKENVFLYIFFGKYDLIEMKKDR